MAWWSVQEAVLFADGIIKYCNILCWWLIGTHNTATIIRIHCQCKTPVWPQEVTEYQWLKCSITWGRINSLKVCFYQNTNTFFESQQQAASSNVRRSLMVGLRVTCAVLEYWEMLIHQPHSSFSDLVVSVLASGTQDHGFKPGRSRRIFWAKKSSARLPSEGK
jgi:hypothetical protein